MSLGAPAGRTGKTPCGSSARSRSRSRRKWPPRSAAPAKGRADARGAQGACRRAAGTPGAGQGGRRGRLCLLHPARNLRYAPPPGRHPRICHPQRGPGPAGCQIGGVPERAQTSSGQHRNRPGAGTLQASCGGGTTQRCNTLRQSAVGRLASGQAPASRINQFVARGALPAPFAMRERAGCGDIAAPSVGGSKAKGSGSP